MITWFPVASFCIAIIVVNASIMSVPTTPKKKSMFKRLFSKKSFDFEDEQAPAVDKKKSPTNGDTSPEMPPCLPSTSKETPNSLIDQKLADAPVGLKKKMSLPLDNHSSDKPRKISAGAKKKKPRKESVITVDTHKPLDFPCTPELILEYHKRKAFLSGNEEWLLVELNEYECLVENEDIIKIIAKHSKFFEVDPDELWAEFFDFVGELSCYDDIINYDVWQEFRDKKYLC